MGLRSALKDEKTTGEAAEYFRALVENIVLTPKIGQDELAGILSMAAKSKALDRDAPTKNDSST